MELSDTKRVSLALPWVEADKTESLPSIPLELDLGPHVKERRSHEVTGTGPSARSGVIQPGQTAPAAPGRRRG